MSANDIALVSLRSAWRYWLKLGLVSFGGPAGQIALMHQELVERRGWIGERRFLRALNYCLLLPGPEAQQLATYLGWLLHGTRGALVAGGLFVLPSWFILVALSWVYVTYGQMSAVAGVFAGVKPVVTAIVIHAAYRIGRRVLKSPLLWLLAVAACAATLILHWPFPVILGLAALCGYVGARFGLRAPAVTAPLASTAPGMQPQASVRGEMGSLWGTRLSRRLLATVLIGAGCWLLPMGWLLWTLGWQHTLTQTAWFFTKAALLTFGGAYAVLPYVYQGAVLHYAWLTAPQMLDGLAFGETTPGPLIMVVAFVGFVGGYHSADALALAAQLPGSTAWHAFWAGSMCAAVATWFTFLPSFLLVLLGAPVIEATQRELPQSAPLSAVGAAVVGVIFSLGLYFAGHVLWPHGYGAGLDWPALALVCAALPVLWLRPGAVVPVIVAGALVGLAMSRLR